MDNAKKKNTVLSEEITNEIMRKMPISLSDSLYDEVKESISGVLKSYNIDKIDRVLAAIDYFNASNS